jgi:hypothetical protein
MLQIRVLPGLQAPRVCQVLLVRKVYPGQPALPEQLVL